jgi:hypothetical protein
MSATRDKNQKTTFVYSNLYHLYKKGKDAAAGQPIAVSPSRLSASQGQVLKTDALTASQMGAQIRVEPKAEPVISPYTPVELLGKRVERPAILPAAKTIPAAPALPSNTAIDSLKDNLKSLNDLQSRLRFMLQELEDLVSE